LKTLDQIVEARRANAAYLCCLFRRYDHQSPYQYLLRLKMNQSAKFLQPPGTLVNEVPSTLASALRSTSLACSRVYSASHLILSAACFGVANRTNRPGFAEKVIAACCNQSPKPPIVVPFRAGLPVEPPHSQGQGKGGRVWPRDE
jgi:hypothetical protein